MTRRTTFAVVGIAVAVVGLIIGGVLWWLAGDREERSVAELARAPVGCDTTLDFDATGTYRLYVELSGRFEAVPGDCEVPASGNYDVRGDVEAVDAASLTLLDPDGNEVTIDDSAIDDTSGVTYDAAGYRGEQVGSVTIDTTGDYILRAEGPAQINVAIGGDPGEWTTAFRVAAVVAIVLGLAVAGVLLMRATRRDPTEPSADVVWTPPPAAPWPTSPPGHPVPPPTTGASGVARPGDASGPPVAAPTPPSGSGGPSAPDGPLTPPGGQIPGQPSVPGAPERADPWAPPESR